MHRHVLLIMAVVGLLGGCVSRMTVVPATSSSTGVRYFLPEVFIQVTPNQDGTVTVVPVYLPDPKHEYAIKVDTYLGNHTIDITRTKEGFLDTLTFNSDSTGVAKQLLSSTAAARAAEVDAQAAKAKAEVADAKSARDKDAAALAAAEKVLKDAQIVVDVAQSKLKILQELKEPPATREQLLPARLALDEAIIKRDAAQSTLATVSSDLAAANAAPKTPMAPEPAFFWVKMSKDDVKLRQAFAQQNRETWKVPGPEKPAGELRVLPSSHVLGLGKAETRVAIVKADQALRSAVLAEVRDASNSVVSVRPVFALMPDKLSVTITFLGSTPPGDYFVDGIFDSGSEDKPNPATKTLRFVLEK